MAKTRNPDSIPDLMAIYVKDRTSLMIRTKIALHTFGYASITKAQCDRFKVDMQAAAEDYGWTLQEGVLSWSIDMENSRHGTDLVIGDGMPEKQKNVKSLN